MHALPSSWTLQTSVDAGWLYDVITTSFTTFTRPIQDETKPTYCEYQLCHTVVSITDLNRPLNFCKIKLFHSFWSFLGTWFWKRIFCEISLNEVVMSISFVSSATLELFFAFLHLTTLDFKFRSVPLSSLIIRALQSKVICMSSSAYGKCTRVHILILNPGLTVFQCTSRTLL